MPKVQPLLYSSPLGQAWADVSVPHQRVCAEPTRQSWGLYLWQGTVMGELQSPLLSRGLQSQCTSEVVIDGAAASHACMVAAAAYVHS